MSVSILLNGVAASFHHSFLIDYMCQLSHSSLVTRAKGVCIVVLFECLKVLYILGSLKVM